MMYPCTIARACDRRHRPLVAYRYRPIGLYDRKSASSQVVSYSSSRFGVDLGSLLSQVGSLFLAAATRRSSSVPGGQVGFTLYTKAAR